jgi:hypothetical protein
LTHSLERPRRALDEPWGEVAAARLKVTQVIASVIQRIEWGN